MMSKAVVLSDKYSWSASWGVFDWLVGFLLREVDDPNTRQHLQDVREYNLTVLDARALPADVQQRLLERLREGLLPAAEADPVLGVQPAVVKHIKGLRLMADDILGARGEPDGG